jgi:hypothetical protein
MHENIAGSHFSFSSILTLSRRISFQKHEQGVRAKSDKYGRFPSAGTFLVKNCFSKVLCAKAHCCDTKSAYSAKYLFFFDKCIDITVPELEKVECLVYVTNL